MVRHLKALVIYHTDWSRLELCFGHIHTSVTRIAVHRPVAWRPEILSVGQQNSDDNSGYYLGITVVFNAWFDKRTKAAPTTAQLRVDCLWFIHISEQEQISLKKTIHRSQQTWKILITHTSSFEHLRIITIKFFISITSKDVRLRTSSPSGKGSKCTCK